MQRERVLHLVYLGGADDVFAHHPHRMKRDVQIPAPEIEELSNLRIIRRQIHILPDKGLQQGRMIRHVVIDFHRRQPILLELQLKRLATCSAG